MKNILPSVLFLLLVFILIFALVRKVHGLD